MLSVSNQYHDVTDAVKYLPCVSIIMPFDPKMSQRTVIESRLKSLMKKIKTELEENYPDEKAVPVFKKLSSLIKDLNYSTHKKSIAVFVSPLVAKVYYLDIPVKEKIVTDDSFEIRDLIYNKKEVGKYLMLALSSKGSTIFTGSSTEFTRIVSNTSDHAAAVKNHLSKPVANLSDMIQQKEMLSDKFLQRTDNGLAIILKSYPFPLFVVGTEQVIKRFKKLTNNNDRILNYVHGNFEEASETELRKAIATYVADWKKIKQRNLLRQLNVALENNQLSIGIEDVFTTACLQKGRVLIMENNYVYFAQNMEAKDIYISDYTGNNTPFYIKDTVDEVIEKVLENGGDVEFVDAGVLKDYHHIALIKC